MSIFDNLDLGAKPIYGNVKGAPFKAHQRVTIGKQSDGDCWEEFERYIGREGKIIYFEYECGCGQTYPDWPMIGVRLFDNNEVQEFWPDELEVDKNGTIRI